MKFEDLPAKIQEIASQTLADLITNSNPDKEQAEELARSVSVAFVSLYKEDSLVVEVGNIEIETI
ncbi:TPA: hypothetical protein ACNH0U_003759 [Proteus mirabilis]